MTTWLIRRLIQALFVIIAMSVIVFIGVHVVGNPVDILISPEADQAERARIIAQLGLDQPVWKQYLLFVVDALHGDLGRSFVFNEPALTLIAQRMPATMELAVTAVLMSIVFGIPLGLYAGLYPDSAVLVFGHSHIPWDTTTETGLRLLNPGSPTDRRRQPFCTYMTAGVDNGAVTDVTLHRIDK